MNYYEAREIKGSDDSGTGLFHFTKMNDGAIWPVGYCAEGCPGHATKDEANEHYRAWVLDNQVRVSEDSNQQRKCAECGDWTSSFVQFGQTESHFLCEKDQRREVYEKLYPAPGSIISSW